MRVTVTADTPIDRADTTERPKTPDRVDKLLRPSPVDTENTLEPEGIEDERVTVETVEGLPLSLVKAYADRACWHARVHEVDPGVWFASVAGLDGAWGEGDTAEEAIESLREAIIGWVAVKRRLRIYDIPPIEGIDLDPPEARAS